MANPKANEDVLNALEELTQTLRTELEKVSKRIASARRSLERIKNCEDKVDAEYTLQEKEILNSKHDDVVRNCSGAAYDIIIALSSATTALDATLEADHPATFAAVCLWIDCDRKVRASRALSLCHSDRVSMNEFNHFRELEASYRKDLAQAARNLESDRFALDTAISSTYEAIEE
jgi:hypothetical protein